MTIQPGDKCEKCGDGYYTSYGSKTSIKKNTRTTYYRCKECRHIPVGNKIIREITNPFRMKAKRELPPASV